MSCQHEDIGAEVRTARILTEEGGDVQHFVAEVRIQCRDCGEDFGFRGMPPGMNYSGPTRSADAKEVHLPLLSPSQLALQGPLAGLQPDPPVEGPSFTIDVRTGEPDIEE